MQVGGLRCGAIIDQSGARAPFQRGGDWPSPGKLPLLATNWFDIRSTNIRPRPIPFIGSTTLHSFQTSVTMNTARIMRLQPFRQAASAVKQPLREPLLRQQARPFHQSRTMLRSKVREEDRHRDTGC